MIGCHYELSLCCVEGYGLCLHLLLFFKIYFIFLVDRGIKPTSTCGAGDGVRVCLLAGGPLDCSQSSIFP